MARFFRRGKSKIYFLPAVAVPATGPTSAEVAAGTDLTPGIQAIAGFQLDNTPIATPDLSSVFNKTIPGEDATATSTLTFYDDLTGTPTPAVRTIIPKGTTGYIILMPYGNVTAKRCEVWNVQVTGLNDEWSVGNDPARIHAGFAVLDTPAQTAALP